MGGLRTLGIVCVAALAASCDLPKEPPVAFIDNWDKLCATADCNQFPLGYRAQKVGKDFYYFPLKRTGETQWLSPAESRYVDLNERGIGVRSADIASYPAVALGYSCCQAYVDRFGLNPPQQAGFTDVVWAELHTDYYRFGPNTLLVSKPMLRLDELARFETPDDIAARDFASFNSDFLLIKDAGVHDPDLPGSKSRLLLVSKEPLVFGRYIVIECGAHCEGATVVFTSDAEPEKPNLTVHLSTAPCPDETRACPVGETPYEVIPDTLSWIESIFLALKKRPTAAPVF